jgi:hypothetical protein
MPNSKRIYDLVDSRGFRHEVKHPASSIQFTQSPQFFVKLGQLAQALKSIRQVHKPHYGQQSCQELRYFCKELIFNDLSIIESLREIIDIQRLALICAKIALV